MYRQVHLKAQSFLQSLWLEFPKKEMEQEYKSIKERKVMKDYQICVLFLIVLNTVSVIFAVIGENWTEAGVSGGTIVGLFLLFCIRNCFKNYLQFMTLFVIISYNIVRLVLVYAFFTYQSKTRLFFSGYGLASLQGILLLRLPNVSHKVCGMIFGLIMRFVYVSGYVEPGSFNISVFIRHFLVDGFIVYTIYTQERISRKIYQDFAQKKEELLKFKELLSDYLPQSLAVVTYKTNKLLFCNKAFQNTFDNHGKLNSASLLQADDVLQASLESLLVEQTTLRETDSPNSCLALWNSLDHPLSLQLAIEKLSSNDYLSQKTISFAASTRDQEKRKLFEVTLKKVRWDSEEALAILSNDITYQENLIALKMANINKDKVIATVSHELRTPLNGIIGILDITEKKVKNPEVTEYLSLCKDNAHLLLSLVNSILDLQQISAGKLKLNAAKVDVRRVIDSIVQLFNFQCKEKNISLECAIHKDVPMCISTDENRLKQILINLVGNALKFTSKGGIKIKVNPLMDSPDYLQISVTDTGIGIKKEDQKRLFKMYSKIENGESVNKNGVGLGLTISNALAILLGGNSNSKGIKATSEYEIGSKFAFEIVKNLQEESQIKPEVNKIVFGKEETTLEKYIEIDSDVTGPLLIRKVAEEQNILQENDQQNDDEFFTSSNIQAKMTSYTSLKRIILPKILKAFDRDSYFVQPQSEDYEISPYLKEIPQNDDTEINTHFLIVDDNPFNLLVAKNLLKEFKCTIKTALSGEEAIKIIKTSSSEGIVFKAVFMDCQMPIMDGFDTTKALKAFMKEGQIPDTAIYGWTANNSEEDIKRCYDAGMIGHLPKPASKLDIMKVVNELRQ